MPRHIMWQRPMLKNHLDGLLKPSIGILSGRNAQGYRSGTDLVRRTKRKSQEASLNCAFAKPTWVYPNLVKGLQFGTPSRGSCCVPDLCVATRGFCVPDLSCRCVLTHVHRLEPFSTHRCAVTSSSGFRWHWLKEKSQLG